MKDWGFVGPSYQSLSPIVDAEDCTNLFPERVESNSGKSRVALYYTPGTKVFCVVQERAILGQKFVPAQNRYFFAATHLYESDFNGNVTNWGPLNLGATGPAQMVVNPTQMLICSDGLLFVFTFSTNTLAPLGSPTGIKQVGYSDGFGIALIRSSNTFRLSAINDFTTWPSLSTTNVSLFPDNIVSMLVDHREIVLLGNTVSTVYTNVGAPIFPFQPVPGAYIEQGSNASFAPVKLDNSVFWLSADDRGKLVAFRSQGYQGIRISNHAVEAKWQAFGTSSDAIGYSYQENGHAFWVIYFPTANQTWVYDVSTNMWHKRGYWTNGIFTAHRSQNHAQAFGMHLVGDWASGTVFQMSTKFYDDAGNPKRWRRRAPYICDELKYVIHNYIQFDLETGLGPTPPIAGPSQFPDFITLMDSTGQLWQVYVDDSGNLIGGKVNAGTVGSVVLNDPYDSTSSWLLGIDTNGDITASPVTYQKYFPVSYGLSTSPGMQNSGIGITHAGSTLGLVYALLASPASRGPEMILRWSDDGAKTWSNEYILNCGKAGEYKTRVIKRRLGRARSRVYEASGSDPIPWAFADAYLDVQAV